MLPHVHNERRGYRKEGRPQDAEAYLACEQCYPNTERAARRLMNCGFEPRIAGNRGQYPLPENAPRPECDTCPGYLISLPQVIETARAYGWWDKGQLRDFCDGETPPRLLRDYIDVYRGAVAEVESARLERPAGA